MENTLLLSGLETILGQSYKKSKGNYAFNCPFCHHKKPKLEIQLTTDSKGRNFWECWVCQTKGGTVRSLLKQLQVPREQALEVLSLVKNEYQVYNLETTKVTLPEEFKTLYDSSPTSITAGRIKNYLYSRGLTDIDFLRYNIGYCTEGEYSDRIIIPSYDENNNLNFFISRTFENSYIKYKNPSVSKDVIIFENLINWDLPIVLVEGVFDAFGVKRNAIPMLGKNPSKSLMKKIIEKKVSEIYIVLDSDAFTDALKISEKFLKNGINTYLVKLEEKDPSQVGFDRLLDVFENTLPLDNQQIIKFKLANI